MRLNIAHKIFSVALVVLVLMAAVALYSIRLTALISDELSAVADRHLPLAEGIARADAQILESGLFLQRLFVGAESPSRAAERDRIRDLGRSIRQELEVARALLAAETAETPLIRAAMAALADRVGAIEKVHRAFDSHALALLAAHEEGDQARFATLLPDLEARQDAVDEKIAGLRRRVVDLTNDAVLRADRGERFLLIANAVLTGLAALLGLGLAALVTRWLVRAVRDLLAGTEAVEAGQLDTEVRVTTTDEIGALAGSFNRMVGELRLKERIKETFGKYMDPRVVADVLDHPGIAEAGGEHREMSVLFADVKGFTTISEKLAADETVALINDFITMITHAVADHKGVVDKFMGDAVMAYWGPPFTGPNEHAELACRAALEAVARLPDFRRDAAKMLGAKAANLDVDFRVGVSTGEMIVGTVGSDITKNYTVMGDPVNLGSRLEGASKAYGTRILVAEVTRDAAGESVISREIDSIRVKGKHEPVRIHELLGLSGDVDEARLTLRSRFEAGLAAYRAAEWDAAEAAFRECLTAFPNDGPAQTFIGRIEHFRLAPPPADWDGVWTFETK